jgi:hypothetical protein
MAGNSEIILLPDAGPLITLAYADALDLLLQPGWTVQVPDMVLHELTRSRTPTSEKIQRWQQDTGTAVVATRTFDEHCRLAQLSERAPRSHGLGERAIQEIAQAMASISPEPVLIVLFEDHKLARRSFVLPAACLKMTTRALLSFLETSGRLASAEDVASRAVAAGRLFSRLRFP